MTSYEWKVLIAILVIFVIGGVVQAFRKTDVSAIPPNVPYTPAVPTNPSNDA